MLVVRKNHIVDEWAETPAHLERAAKLGLRVYTGAVESKNGILYEKGFAPVDSDNDLARTIRRERDRLLRETDKFVCVPDFPITAEKRAEYQAYRQKLRDLPMQTGFPRNIVFPVDPAE
nr:MAG TPA: tail assembly chaperone protein [Caudoviricetes sp.]